MYVNKFPSMLSATPLKTLKWPIKRWCSGPGCSPGCNPTGPKKECACEPDCPPVKTRPADCTPGPIHPNPCCPQPRQPNARKFKLIFYFVAVPLILIQYYNASSHQTPDKDECRDYEYMLIRTKRFPWGDGVKSLFHNDRVNHLPGECVPPEPEDCE